MNDWPKFTHENEEIFFKIETMFKPEDSLVFSRKNSNSEGQEEIQVSELTEELLDEIAFMRIFAQYETAHGPENEMVFKASAGPDEGTMTILYLLA